MVEKNTNKYASFFGGAKPVTDTKEYIDSIRIGEILSQKGYIVKNGGYRGLMEAVSKGSGNAIGYVCKTFGTIKGNEYLKEKVVTEDIFDRLRFLIEGSSLFIIQKGGYGTLAELFLTLDLVRKQDIKPKIILIGDVWFDVLNNLTLIIPENELSLFSMVTDIEDLNDII